MENAGVGGVLLCKSKEKGGDKVFSES